MVTNPKTVSWVNSGTGIDQNGNTVTWNPVTDMAGVQIAFDGQAPVSVATGVATSLALAGVSGYSTLAMGQHTLTVVEVTKEGAVSAPSATVTFLVAVVPMAPTNVVVA